MALLNNPIPNISKGLYCLCVLSHVWSNLIDTVVLEDRQKSVSPFRDGEIDIHRNRLAYVSHTTCKCQNSALENGIFFLSALLCSFIKLTTIKKNFADLFDGVGSYLWCLGSLIFVMACEI